MPNTFDAVVIRDADGAVPALAVVNVPTVNKGVPAVNVYQNDATGPAVQARGNGTLLDLQDTTGTSKFKVDGSGNLTLSGSISGQSGMSNPMTTLGDIIYEDSSPTAVRLAGNTTSTKKFLTQTGNGAVSAAPSWGTIAAGDVPTLNQSTTGTASNVTGVVARANGGTGVATTPAAAAGYAPANPTATSSVTLVMMGLGSTCTFTPASSGKVLVIASTYVTTATGLVAITLGPRYGTGGAPSNGAAVTGTAWGATADPTVRAPAVGLFTNMVVSTVLSLTPSTAYWFDLALATANSSDAASMVNVTYTLVELA